MTNLTKSITVASILAVLIAGCVGYFASLPHDAAFGFAFMVSGPFVVAFATLVGVSLQPPDQFWQ